MTDAAAHDGARLPDLLDKTNTASGVWADTAYRLKKNEAFMAQNSFVSKVHRKKPKSKPMPEKTRKTNALKSIERSKIEHVYAHQKEPMAAAVRNIGKTRTETKIGMINLAYNMRRFLWLESRT